MPGKKSDAVIAAQVKLRQRVDRQLLVVEAFIRANQQVDAAQARLKAIEEENQARAGAAEDAIAARKRERAETLAGLAVVVNDDAETAGLVDVTVAEVRSARRSVSADRAREVAARAARGSAPRATGQSGRRIRSGASSRPVATTALFLPAGTSSRSSATTS